MTRELGPKRCTAKTRAGNSCRAWPLEGGKLCLAHDVKARESARFGGVQPGAGRPALPKPSDIQRHLLEQHITEILAPLYRTIGFDIVHTPEGLALQPRPEGGARLHGTSQRDGSINMSKYDDLGAQVAVVRELLDRVYGRPKQAMQVTGADGGPILLRIGQMLTPETAVLAAELADRLAIEASHEDDSSAGAA